MNLPDDLKSIKAFLSSSVVAKPACNDLKYRYIPLILSSVLAAFIFSVNLFKQKRALFI